MNSITSRRHKFVIERLCSTRRELPSCFLTLFCEEFVIFHGQPVFDLVFAFIVFDVSSLSHMTSCSQITGSVPASFPAPRQKR